jgi:hypothetical protein
VALARSGVAQARSGVALAQLGVALARVDVDQYAVGLRRRLTDAVKCLRRAAQHAMCGRYASQCGGAGVCLAPLEDGRAYKVALPCSVGYRAVLDNPYRME